MPSHTPDTSEGAPAGHPWVAFAPRLVAWAAVLAVITFVDPDPSASLMLLALVGVVTIVTESRFSVERRIEARGLPSREAWVPLVMLAVMAAYGLVDRDNLAQVVRDDGPVIAFILSFALVSEGLRRSGFIHFLAYRMSERGGGNTTRLTLYLFLLSSLLTYFTSNDIVVLTMTPIVVSVAHQARIGNAKLLLLSQFVAANTVSMGILIGSPTNLILGRALDMGFVEYMFLMLVPSAVALMGTFVFVTAVNGFVARRAVAGGRLSRRLVGTWAYTPTYRPPRFSEYRAFTPRMRHWVGVFGLSVVLLALSTATSAGLLAVVVVIAVLAVWSLRRDERAGGDTPAGFAGRAAKVLPLGIVFFGLTYFVIADAVADAPFVRDQVDTFATEHGSSHTPVASWGSLLSSGVLVNTMNDLPAAALSGKILPRVEFATPFDEAVVTQGVLAGLNIATYVTPVGALAGIIWFDILRRERARRGEAGVVGPAVDEDATVDDATDDDAPDVVVPTRRDLVVYGTSTFLVMALVLGATNFGVVALADVLLGPTSGGTEFGGGAGHAAWLVACLAVGAAVVVAFRRVLRRGGVELAHLGNLLAFLGRARMWSARHRFASAVLVVAAAYVAAGTALYWAEQFHAREYGVEAPFDGPSDFASWLFVFVTSGFSRGEFPNSLLGTLLAGAMALGAIAAVVVLVRRAGRPGDDTALRQRLARGELPADRLVVVNADGADEPVVAALAALAGSSGRAVVVATPEPAGEEAEPAGRGPGPGPTVVRYTGGAGALAGPLRLADARELVLLSRSMADDFANLALLTALDAAVVGDDGDGGVAGPAAEAPAVVVQAHGHELAALLAQRLGPSLRAGLVVPPLAALLRHRVVGAVTGAEPGLASPLGATPHAVLRPPDLPGRPAAADAPAAAHAPVPAGRVVVVVGGGRLAQGCAADLARTGAAVTLVAPAGATVLPPDADGDGNRPTVVRATTPAEVAAVLGGEGPGEATVLVVEEAGEDGEPPPTEALLTRLSVARFAVADAGDPVPPLVVCCRGAARAERLRGFVVDRVVDAAEVEAGYAAAFAAVFYGLPAPAAGPGAWPVGARLAAADAVAARLAHLDVRPATAPAAGDGAPLALARPVLEDGADGPLVAVDLVVPAPDGPAAPADLLLSRPR